MGAGLAAPNDTFVTLPNQRKQRPNTVPLPSLTFVTSHNMFTDLMLELIMENASAPYDARVIPGCELPSWGFPRLVGVELNPGPPKTGSIRKASGRAAIVDMAAAAGATLANVLANGVPKRKKTKRKKLSLARADAVLVRQDVVSSQNPPISYAPTIRSRARMGNQKVIIPFDLCNAFIYTNSSGYPNWFGSSSTVFNLEMDPNSMVGGSYVFGYPLFSVATHFRKFRFLKLFAEYEPLCPTSTAGALGFVSYADPAILPNQNFGMITLGSSDGAIISPPWKKFEIPMDHITKEWCFTKDATSQTTAAYRQESPGMIVTTGTGLPPSVLIGVVKLTGLLELLDLTESFTPPTDDQPTDPTPILIRSEPMQRPATPIPASRPFSPVNEELSDSVILRSAKAILSSVK